MGLHQTNGRRTTFHKSGSSKKKQEPAIHLLDTIPHLRYTDQSLLWLSLGEICLLNFLKEAENNMKNYVRENPKSADASVPITDRRY